jgi:formylglycine-generating enzyme
MTLIACRLSVAEPFRIHIAGGWFFMGSDSGKTAESPVHRVDSFCMAATQVTVEEYARFLDAQRQRAAPILERPLSLIPSLWWKFHGLMLDILRVAFINGRLTLRLPTEAEWERAARGGAERMTFPWGDDPPTTCPGYHIPWKTGPEPVGQSESNAYGLFDMCENVHEWCSDWYGADYYAISPDRNPQGPEEGSRKASRGGSWRHQVKISHCSAPSSIPPDFKYADYGFRVVCDRTL